MKKLNQNVFEGQPPEVKAAYVDYDGMLKFGKNSRQARYTWTSERWRGDEFVSKIPNTDYESLTHIIRQE